MSFDVAAAAYGRFMGRYSEPLAVEFAKTLGLVDGLTALDVGSGPGALTAQLVARLGPDAVAAVDPSEQFVAAARERFPGADVRVASAEKLPFADDAFDVAAAQLVVHFLSDPVAGVREMARVTRPGGLIAACVWDYAGGRDPLATFWRATHELGLPDADESDLPGTREGHLALVFTDAGLRDIRDGELQTTTLISGFSEWWDPFTLGVGPAGDYYRQLTPPQQDALRAHCAESLPAGAFEVTSWVWSVTGRV